MLMLKIWHYLNYKAHYHLCVQRKTDALLDAYGSFWKFQEVSQRCNMLQLGIERCSSVSALSVDYFLTIISVNS